MKLGLIFAVATLGASAASAAEPASVVGAWSPQKLTGVVAMSPLQFTSDGQVFSLSQAVSFTLRPGVGPQAPVLPPLNRALIGRYETQGDKVIIRLDSRTSTTFELTKDGRLCVYPGPALMNGEVRRQPGERQCYERQGAGRS